MKDRFILFGILAMVMVSVLDNIIHPYTSMGVSMAIAPALLAMGTTALTNLLGKQFGRQKNPMASPEEIDLQAPSRGNYQFNQSELSGINSEAIDRLMRGGANTQRNIMQTGAATGAPDGAVLDSLAGANYNLGRGHAGLSSNLAGMKLQGKTNYANAKQRYDFKNADNRQRYFEGGRAADNADAGAMSSMFGDLGKIGLLWSGGFFDKQE
jgi:hypothetical protein